MTASAESEGAASLPPMYAFLISTLVMLAGAAIGWATLRNRLLMAFVLLGITAMGGIALFTVALGMSTTALVVSVGVLLLATVAAAVITRVMVQALGMTGAVVAAVIGWVAQVAVVAQVWSVTSVSEIDTIWRVLAGLMPLHYPTFALTSLGNSGTVEAIWMAVAVLGGLMVLGGVALWRLQPQPVAADVGEPGEPGESE